MSALTDRDTSLRAGLWLLCPLLVWSAGCTGDSTAVNPVPIPAADAATTDGPVVEDAGDEATLREAGPIRRQVFERSPFGNLDRAGDLLVDPDFEWSTGRGQTGWVAMDDTGQQRVTIETGGTCRSGLRCVKIEGTTGLLGRGIGAANGGTTLSLWAKVSEPTCDILSIYLLRGMTYTYVSGANVRPVADAPDEHGWCRFEGTAPPQPEPIDVYIELKPSVLKTYAILDEASLRPSDGMSAMAAPGAWQIDEAARERVLSRLARLRKQRWYGRAPAPGSEL